jgi:uncharacterized alpha/beta hydrolase family protein
LIGAVPFRIQKKSLEQAIPTLKKLVAVEEKVPEGTLSTDEDQVSVTQSAAATTPTPEEADTVFKAESTYKFTPTIYIKGQEEERLSVGGWRIPGANIDALCNSIQASSNITSLS